MTTLAGEPEVVVRPDAEAVSAAAAERIAAAIGAAIEARGLAHFCTTGGSTPVGIYLALSRPPLRDRVAWDRVHVWWGDDRFVPRDNPLSNVRSFEDVLLRVPATAGISGQGSHGADVLAGAVAGVPIQAQNVHHWPTTEAIAANRTNDWCAEAYAELAASMVPLEAGRWPVFDLVLVGIGDDGHVLSVFPGSQALDSDAVALGIPAPTHIEPHVPRVTFNPRVLDVTPTLLAVTSGASKAAPLGHVFGPERDIRRWPSQRGRREGATWILDESAAANLASSIRGGG